jgi:hypothetical protein
MTAVPTQVLEEIKANFPSHKAQLDDAPLIAPSHDDWNLGHKLYSRLTAAAQANTCLKLLPDGVTYSLTNIGPIEVDHTHINSSESGSIRVSVRKGDLRDVIATIYIGKEYIIINSPRLWGERQKLYIATQKTEEIIRHLEVNLNQYRHLIW